MHGRHHRAHGSAKSAEIQFPACVPSAGDQPHSVAGTVAWLQRTLWASQRRLPAFGPAELASSLWALVHLDCDPPEAWVRAYLSRLQALLPRFSARDLAGVVWGLAAADVYPGAEAMRAVCGRLAALLPAFGPQDASNVLWALATLGFVPSRSWQVGWARH